MAKDPAFLFYDGDACRDMAHMNRLERGAYTDIIIAQRKFGRLSFELIKKLLGTDFEPCWGAIEVTLTVDNGTYYIEWLEDAITRRKAYTEGRKKNFKKNGKTNKKETPDMGTISTTYDTHIENEIVNETIIVTGIEKEDEKKFMFNAEPDVTESWDVTKAKFLTDTLWEESVGITKNMSPADLKSSMKAFIDDLEFKNDKKNLYHVRNHYINKLNKVQFSIATTPKKDKMIGTFNVDAARRNMADLCVLDEIERLKKEGFTTEAEDLKRRSNMGRYDDIFGDGFIT